jgi:peptidoglycan/xylan/chitin deacetylase (PgdA/CDA1 family)
MIAKRLFIAVLLALAACAPSVAAVAPTETPLPPTQTPPLPTLTPTAPSATPSPTPSPSPTPEPTATLVPSPTSTPTPMPTPDAQARTRSLRLPILMYHYVEPWPQNASEIRKGLTVRPDDFRAQMTYLHDNGYAALSLYDLTEALALGKTLPEKSVVITFDDGYRSLMDYAFPTMREFGFTGTVFVITEFMDRGLTPYLTWDQARTLYAAGWRIESHSKTHTTLAGRDRDKLIFEILGSVQTIEANLGARPRFLCYPGGEYDALSIQIAREVDLWGAVTTHGGSLHGFADRFEWTRRRVDGRGALRDFVNAVSGELK